MCWARQWDQITSWVRAGFSRLSSAAPATSWSIRAVVVRIAERGKRQNDAGLYFKRPRFTRFNCEANAERLAGHSYIDMTCFFPKVERKDTCHISHVIGPFESLEVVPCEKMVSFAPVAGAGF
jgi:hypothetical protein